MRGDTHNMAKAKAQTLDVLIRSVATKLDEAFTRMDAIEARTAEQSSPDALTRAQASAKKTGRKIDNLHGDDDNLNALAQLVKRQAKAKFARRCAGHSLDALLTYQNAGGKSARAFMADEAKAITDGRTDMGLVVGSTTYNYVRALAAKLGGTPVGKPVGKARGRPRKAS